MPKSPEHRESKKVSSAAEKEDLELTRKLEEIQEPYRKLSRERAEAQAEEDTYYQSDDHRDYLREFENENLKERLKRHDEEKQKEIQERFKRRFGRDISISEEELDKLTAAQHQSHQEYLALSASYRKKQVEGPLETAREKAEEFKRTYLRRKHLKPLSEMEAARKEAYVLEWARRIAEQERRFVEMDHEIWGENDQRAGWEGLTRHNARQNNLSQPLDERITQEIYEESLEQIERLQEVPISRFRLWLQAKATLAGLRFTAWMRKLTTRS